MDLGLCSGLHRNFTHKNYKRMEINYTYGQMEFDLNHS